MKLLKNIFLLILLTLFTFPAFSELSVEEIIKGRQAIFSENYKTAKRVQALSSDIEFEAAIELMNKMSENYKNLLDYFPENSKEGFDTEALPTIWENKDEFNALMQKASDDMLTLAIDLVRSGNSKEDIKSKTGLSDSEIETIYTYHKNVKN